MVLILFCTFPVLLNPYLIFVINMFFIYTILSLGLNLLLGYAGQFAFANGAFYGIGAYSTMLLQIKLGLPYYFSLFLAGIITSAVGIIVGLPAVRMRGLYLAIVTLAFAFLTQWTMIHWETLTFGAGGSKSPAPSFDFFRISHEEGMYYLSLLVCCLLILLTRNIIRSRIGRAFVAIRDSEIAAEVLGINLTVYKSIAFGLSAFYAGIAGGLYSAVLQFVSPEGFDLFQVITHFAMVVVGGLASIIGSVLGAGAILFMIELTRGMQNFQEILFGGIIMIFVIFLPDGIYSLIRERIPFWKETLSRGDEAAKKSKGEITNGDYQH